MDHLGTIIAIKPGIITVQITSVSACASCQAHSRCGFADSKTKTLDIPINSQPSILNSQFKAGDTVNVTIDHSRGLLATWWAYVLPALLLLTLTISLSIAGLSEPLVILLTLTTLGLYILIIYLLRKKLDSKFTLLITPLKQVDNQSNKQC